MKKVLILEDEENIRSFVVINLQRAGYKIIEAGTGAQALEVYTSVDGESWSLSNTIDCTDEDIVVENVHLGDSLMILNCRICRNDTSDKSEDGDGSDAEL